MRGQVLALVLLLLAPVVQPTANADELTVTDPVRVTALAVAQTPGGELVGTNATISVSAATDGSGHVFIDTRPLAGTDMQGSARIASRVAGSLTGYSPSSHDLFFVIRSESPLISGPSAGALMTLASVVALENAHLNATEEPWRIDPGVMATGTVTPSGQVGPVGGILEKAKAAADAGAHTFLIPEGQGTYTPRFQQTRSQLGEDPVDVSAYCDRELKITCREIGTVEELVAIATGHRFEQPELGAPPSTAQYASTLAPMTERLVDDAAKLHDVWERLNGTDADPDERQAVASILQQGLPALDAARSALEDDRYYSAASRAFQASIQARHASLLLDFLDAGRSLEMIETTISDADRDVSEARSAARSATVDGLQDVYTVGAAQQRVIRAADHVERARAALNQTAVSDALHEAAFAMERSETVHWWLELGDTFGSGPNLTAPPSEVATDLVDLATETLTYAQSVLRGRGDLSRATQAVDQARTARQAGFDAAAVLLATEAQIKATVPLELAAGEPDQDKINASREQAAEAIQRARGRGLEPVLPIAMFEFASDQSSPVATLELYRTAGQLAGLSGTFTGSDGPRPSTFVEEAPEPLHRSPSDAPPSDEGGNETHDASTDDDAGTESHDAPASLDRRVAAGWFVAGLFSATVVAILVATLANRPDGPG